MRMPDSAGTSPYVQRMCAECEEAEVRRLVLNNVPDSDEIIDEDEIQAGSWAPVVSRMVKVGSVDDPAERQAEKLADAVLRMPEPAMRNQKEFNAQLPLPELRRLHQMQSQNQAPTANTLKGESITQTATRAVAYRGTGQPLSEATRLFFEPRFGVDLARVRIHEGPQVATVAHRLNARAFTYGQDIWLGAGEREGDRPLLAHELSHVVQSGEVSSVAEPLRRFTRTNTLFLWDLYESSGGDSASITEDDLRTTIEYEDYTRPDLVWKFSDTVAFAALRRSMALFGEGVRGRRPNYIRSARETRAATHGLQTITLQQLGFTGDHMIASVSSLGGSRGPNIDDADGSAPVWTLGGGAAQLVAYTAGTPPTMFANFDVSPAISLDVPNVQVRALVGNTVVGELSGLVMTGTVIANGSDGWARGIGGGSPIPGSSSVGLVSEEIKFEVSTDGGRVWFNADSAAISIVFTVATPTPPGADLREDALLAGASAASSAATPAEGLRNLVQSGVSYDPSKFMPSSFATTDAVMEAFTIPHQCDSQAYLLRYLAMTLGIPADVKYFWLGTTSERWLFLVRSIGWHGPSFQCDRPAEDSAPFHPHFLFHALTEIGGTLHDPSYDRTGLPGILERAPGASPILGPRSTFMGLSNRRVLVACPH